MVQAVNWYCWSSFNSSTVSNYTLHCQQSAITLLRIRPKSNHCFSPHPGNPEKRARSSISSSWRQLAAFPKMICQWLPNTSPVDVQNILRRCLWLWTCVELCFKVVLSLTSYIMTSNNQFCNTADDKNLIEIKLVEVITIEGMASVNEDR